LSPRQPAGSSFTEDDAPLPSLIHGKARLLILAHLLRQGPTPFTELRAAVGMTDGTLSVHLARLEAGGVITIEKRFVGKRPQTVAAVTAEGRRRFAAYVEELKRIVPGLAG